MTTPQRFTRDRLFWCRGDLSTVPVEPPYRVKLGETFIIETIDTGDKHPQNDADLKKPNGRWGGNPWTGPVLVEPVQAGDVIAVHIEDIQLASRTFVPIENDTAIFPGGLRALTKPMFGCIGVTPSIVRKDSEPWHHGGNMDIPDICAGNVFHVRSERDGAWFGCGDGHALQGEGEVNGFSLEISLEGRLRIERSPFQFLKTMLIETPTKYITIGIEYKPEDAIKSAIDSMSDLLARMRMVEFADARQFASHVGDVRLGAVWPVWGNAFVSVPYCLHLSKSYFA
jgi:amidase